MLITSFRRASSMTTKVAEARANFRAGVIHENLNQLGKAVEHYTAFLQWYDLGFRA